jgi:hypothetical protein
MMDSAPSREMNSCSAIDLAEIRRSSKFSLWIWSREQSGMGHGSDIAPPLHPELE